MLPPLRKTVAVHTDRATNKTQKSRRSHGDERARRERCVVSCHCTLAPTVLTSRLQAHDDTSLSRTSKVLRSELRLNQRKGSSVDAMGGDGGDLNKRRRTSLEDLKVKRCLALYVEAASEERKSSSGNAAPTVDPANDL